jgi:chromosome segregation ATPase
VESSSAPTEPRPPEEDPDVVDDHRPASYGELRRLRRWLLVATVWAIAATAIAVVAFLEARDAKDAQSSATNATQADIDRVRDRLTEDVQELRDQVDQLPTSNEVDQLATRVRKAQRDANSADNEASDANDAVNSLESRVEDLEESVDSLESSSDGN